MRYNLKMLNKVKSFLDKYNLLAEKKTFLIGFSGGFDSICLLDILHKLSLENNFDITALHLNHNWRGDESQREQNNCETFCKERNIPFYTETLPDNCQKTETAAREYRQEFFKKYYKKLDADGLFLAHTKSDNTETILYRIAKGTGVNGLCGILEHSQLEFCDIFRPLMDFSRRDILDYCRKNSLNANNDSSNYDTKYARNFVRHEIVSRLKELNPDIDDAVLKMSKIAISEQKIIEEYMSKIRKEIKKENGFDTKKFTGLSNDLQNKFILDFLIKNRIDYDSKKVEEIFCFINENSKNKAQKTLSLTTGLWLCVSKEKLYTIDDINPKKNEIELRINSCGCYEFQNFIFKIEEYKKNTPPVFPDETEKTAYINMDKNFDLILRTRKEGDIIQPFGMTKTMKLKKLFINRGVDKFERDGIILLCNNKEVLWAAGVCLSDKLRVETIPTHKISIKNR